MTILISLKLINFWTVLQIYRILATFLSQLPTTHVDPFQTTSWSISNRSRLLLLSPFYLSYLVCDCGFQFTIPWSLVGLVMDKSLESNNSDLLKLTKKTYPVVSTWSCRCRYLSWCYSQSWELQARGTSGSESAGSLPLAQCGAQDSVGSHHSSP